MKEVSDLLATAIKQEANRLKIKYQTDDPYEICDSMKIQVPNVSEYDDGVFVYHSCDGFTSMHSAIKAGEYWSDPPSDSGGSGGSGGFGGGSGGGGGGAF